MSTAGLASAVDEAEGRAETRRAGSARAREPDTSLVLVAAPVQGGREAKPMRASQVSTAGFGITLSKAHR
jgi:hypothetical protein